MRYLHLLTIVALSTVVYGCLGSGESDYALYRNSVMDTTTRIHVATFDAADGEKYNQSNCDIAAKLYQQQDGVKTKFWCKKGRFRK